MSILLKFYSNIRIFNVFYQNSYTIVLTARGTKNAFVGIPGFPFHLLFAFSTLLSLLVREYSGVLGKVYLLISRVHPNSL